MSVICIGAGVPVKRLIARKALEWANAVREDHGLPPVERLEPGMTKRPRDCSLARTIAVGEAFVEDDEAIVFGRRHRLPLWVRLFVRRFDLGEFHELRSVRPTRVSDSVEHLDFEASVPSDEAIGYHSGAWMT